jgi:hypothetical protein
MLAELDPGPAGVIGNTLAVDVRVRPGKTPAFSHCIEVAGWELPARCEAAAEHAKRRTAIEIPTSSSLAFDAEAVCVEP